jgi:5'-nucleotidase
MKNANTKLIVYIDMDDVLCDYSGAYQAQLKARPEIAYPQSQYGFFSSLKPIEAAIESVKSLINDERFNVYILTAPSYMNPLCYTEKRVWIEQYFGVEFTQRLIICADKSLLKGDVLIDDNATSNGQDRFEGALLQYGTTNYANWDSVMTKLLSHKVDAD